MSAAIATLVDGFRNRAASRAESKAFGGPPRRMKKAEALPTLEGADNANPASSTGAPANGSRLQVSPTLIAPYIKPRDYGHFPLRFKPNEDGKVPSLRGEGADKSPYSAKDAQKHFFVWGGSGSGKTFYVLNQIFEATFACTHLPPGPARDELKGAMLVVEAKGDFREKTWWLAKKYDRLPDTFFFGPTHLDIRYNFFADPNELPLTRAGKMLQLMKAYQGGQQSSDPFWDSKSSSLFANIFAMHSTLSMAAARADDPEMKKAFEVEPMSFRLLALLLMDRGQPVNENEVREASENIRSHANSYRESTDRMVPIIGALKADFASQERRLAELQARISSVATSLDQVIGDDVVNEALQAEYESLMGLHRKVSGVVASFTLNELLENPGRKQPTAALDEILGFFEGLHSSTDDMERGKYSNHSAVYARNLKDALEQRLTDIEACDLLELRARVIEFIDATGVMLTVRKKLISLKPVDPKIGALRKMLNQYEELLKAAGKNPKSDEIYEYFEGEYLNIANDKMSGSVGAVASTVVSLFTMHPFDKIFTSDGTFNFSEVIDKGWVVYLDMPTSIYQAAATVAALALKMDFFRACLSRKRTFRLGENGLPTSELINQKRPIFYHADEFASVASKGDYTGEAGFMDKCREYGVSCFLGAQSFDVLNGRLDEKEILSILSNSATMVFLRNPNEKTNEIASKRGGQEYKVETNLTTSATEQLFNSGNSQNRGFSTSYRRGPRYEPDRFTMLQDGQALLCLPPRFGKNSIQIVSFEPHVIEDPEKGGGLPLPEMMELPSEVSTKGGSHV